MKILKYLLVVFTLFSLMSCQKSSVDFKDVERELKLDFAVDEDETNVISDIALPKLSDSLKEVELEWSSNNTVHAEIIEDKVIITRHETMDIKVIITASVMINDEMRAFDFEIIILKKAETTINTFEVKVKDGFKETIYFIADGKNFVESIPQKDGFIFLGYYTNIELSDPWDESPITTAITLYIKWEEKKDIDLNPPTILGTKDIYFIIGDSIDYLYGVTAIDNEDPSPILTVDDSEVDLTKPGVYTLYYLALDINENETIVEVNVYVEEDILASYTETFDQMPASSSSYGSGIFTGVNGIKWEYSGMRTDQTLDGKAITFGKTSSDYLKAQLTGGVSKLSIDFIHAFSGSDTRKVSLFINDQLVHTFEISSSKLTYEVTDINVSGAFTFELRNLSGERVIVDNITIFNDQISQELKDIESDMKNFVFPSFLMSETTLTLIKQGQRGSHISYEFTNTQDPNNAYVNLVTGHVSMPVDQQVDVIITVIFSKGNDSKNIEKTLVIGEGDPITISQALKQPGFVKTKGVLTGFIVEKTYIKGFIQDETQAVEVRFELDQLLELEIGRAYVVKGTLINAAIPFIENVILVDKKEEQIINAVFVDGSSIKQHVSKYVYTTGILQLDYVSGDAHIVTQEGLVQVVVKDLFNPFINQKIGQEVQVTAHVVFDQNIYKLLIIDANDVEVGIFNHLLFETYLLKDLELEKHLIINSDIILKATSALFGLEVSWSSSHEHIVSKIGEVTLNEVETVVTLTYTARKGFEVVYVGTIEVTVSQGSNLTGYYQDADGKTGQELLLELTRIISRNYRSISYKSTNSVLEISDKHPSGQGYLGIYDHTSISSYNKEHVWPQSSFGKASPYVSDMHHLRISVVSTNSARSNYYFNNPTSQTSSWQVGSNRFFPGDQDKGDIARMLMYMAVRYRNDNFKLIVASSGRTSDSPSRTLGNLAVLYQWHLEDPVDNFEINRNQVIYETQNNRNPFIDHPELFEDVWDTFMEEDQLRRLNVASNGLEVWSAQGLNDYQLEVIAIIPINGFMDERYYA